METKMPRQYQIRNAIEEDVSDLVRMRFSLQKHMSESNPYLWQMSQKMISERPDFYRKMIENSDAKLIVVQEINNKSIIGMGLGRKLKHDEFIPNKSGRIDDIWIDHDHRQQGLCAQLLSKLLDFFTEDGIDSLVLDYANGNREAESVWEKFGFQIVLKTATANLSIVKEKLK